MTAIPPNVCQQFLSDYENNKVTKDYSLAPTLSQLVEACNFQTVTNEMHQLYLELQHAPMTNSETYVELKQKGNTLTSLLQKSNLMDRLTQVLSTKWEAGTLNHNSEKKPWHQLIFYQTLAAMLGSEVVHLGKTLKIDSLEKVHKAATRYTTDELAGVLQTLPNPQHSTQVKVYGEDMGTGIEQLITDLKIDPNDIFALIMANSKHPGGGVLYGAGAQEECFIRRTFLYPKLLYWGYENMEYKLTKDRILVAESPLLRGAEKKGAPLLNSPITVTWGAIAARQMKQGEWSQESEEHLREIICNFLNTAILLKKKVCVLSALGCGAFNNPPTISARIWKEEIEKRNGYFTNVFFFIFDARPTDKNLPAFANELTNKEISTFSAPQSKEE